MRIKVALLAACVACLLTPATVQARDAMQSQGTSDGASATSGDASGSSSANLSGGSRSTAGDTASAQQSGSNRPRLTQRSRVRTGAATAGGQTTGVAIGHADVALQGQSTSDGATALSGLSETDLLATVVAGAGAVGSVDASASQHGANAAALDQIADAVSGDAAAGSQIAGIASSGSAAVQQSNAAGPASIGAGGAVALGGDAVAASQVAGLSVEEVVLQAANASTTREPTFANSGQTESSVDAGVITGAQALAADTATAAQSGDNQIDVSQHSGDVAMAALAAGPVAASSLAAHEGLLSTSPAELGSATQAGDNSVTLRSLADATSGDAVSGSQISGIAATRAGAQLSNVADDAFAASGTEAPAASAATIASVQAGPMVNALVSAGASQRGNDFLSVAQTASALSGDAVAGAQVSGIGAAPADNVALQLIGADVGPEGSFASSGIVESANMLLGSAGPIAVAAESARSAHHGAIDAAVQQDFRSASGDAVSASQVTGMHI